MQSALRDDLKAAVLVIALAAASHVAHGRAASAFGQPAWEAVEVPVFFLPTGDSIRALSIGQNTTAADLYFLKMVQYIGTSAAENADWPQLFELANLVTDIDPEYGYAYEVPGILLTSKRRIDESNRIFEKGIAAVPQRWQLPFFCAFNYWYELENLEAGARLLWKAAALPGAPEYTSELASRLAGNTNSLEFALSYAETILAQESNTTVRERMEKRRVEILVEMDLRRLEAAIAEYQMRLGRTPSALTDLLGPTLQRLPVAPDRSSYDYNPSEGAVRHSLLLPKRLRYKKH